MNRLSNGYIKQGVNTGRTAPKVYNKVRCTHRQLKIKLCLMPLCFKCHCILRLFILCIYAFMY